MIWLLTGGADSQEILQRLVAFGASCALWPGVAGNTGAATWTAGRCVSWGARRCEIWSPFHSTLTWFWRGECGSGSGGGGAQSRAPLKDPARGSCHRRSLIDSFS